MQRRRFLQSMALSAVAGAVADQTAQSEAPVRVAAGPVSPLRDLHIALVAATAHEVCVAVVDPGGRRLFGPRAALAGDTATRAMPLPLPARAPRAGRYDVAIVWRDPASGRRGRLTVGSFALRRYQFC